MIKRNNASSYYSFGFCDPRLPEGRVKQMTIAACYSTFDCAFNICHCISGMKAHKQIEVN